MEQALAGEYDPDKFWGYDLMFQFPWDTVENLFQARNFRQEKPEKTENEMVSQHSQHPILSGLAA